MIDKVLFIMKTLSNIVAPIFKTWFKFCYNIHDYTITSSMNGHLHKKLFRTNNFGIFLLLQVPLIHGIRCKVRWMR